MSAITAYRALESARNTIVQAYMAVTDLPRSGARAGIQDALVDIQQGISNISVFIEATYLNNADPDETQDAEEIEDES